MENGPFIDDVPIKTIIYSGFSMAMLNNQMVPTVGPRSIFNPTLHLLCIVPHLQAWKLRQSEESGCSRAYPAEFRDSCRGWGLNKG